MATGTETYYIPSESGGTGTRSVYNRIKVVETWDEVSNTSDFTFTYQGRRSTGSVTTKWYSRGLLKVNGETIIDTNVATENMTLDSEWKDMVSATVENVPHNWDGSLTLIIGREPIGSYSGIWMAGQYNSISYYGNCGSGDYEIVCHKNQTGNVKIDTGSGFETHQAYIDNGTSFDIYLPYVDNGTSWDLCSG